MADIDASPKTRVVADGPVAAIREALIASARSVLLLRESWVGSIGLALVAFWVVVALLAPLLAPFPPTAQIMGAKFAPPMTTLEAGALYLDPTAGMSNAGGRVLWLGGDNVGRDVLSRVIWGARSVLLYAPLATGAAYIVGIVLGLAAGYWRGWVDEVLSRVSDVILSFPVLVLYIVIVTRFQPSALTIVLAITFASAPGIMRIVRGLVLDLRNRDYVAAAQTRGESPLYIMFVEILPNARGPLIVDACLRLGYTTITIGVLGFLGLGLPPPDPNWGNLIAENRGFAQTAPHGVIFPSIAISSLVLGLNMLADGIREVSLVD